MMNTNTIKVKKGGLDTIIAFIVVLLPLVYILIFMVATLYHFTVQMYMNQVVKETLVMASTYGTLTDDMINDYLISKLEKVMTIEEANIKYYVREIDMETGTIEDRKSAVHSGDEISYNGSEKLKKGDLLGIYVESSENSLLSDVSNFNIFKNEDKTDSSLKYSSYREEIIRNEAP